MLFLKKIIKIFHQKIIIIFLKKMIMIIFLKKMIIIISLKKIIQLANSHPTPRNALFVGWFVRRKVSHGTRAHAHHIVAWVTRPKEAKDEVKPA